MDLNVTLNGEARQIPPASSVADMLTGLGLDPAKIAVERNLAIVPRSAYGAVKVEEGDRFEIVHFIGGGNAPVAVPPPSADAQQPQKNKQDKPFAIAGKAFKSRLIIGTGKFKSYMTRMPAPWKPAAPRSSPSRCGG